MRVNYHIHTSFSDGGNSPEELVSLLKNSGVTSFAITDHNEVAANIIAKKLATENGMQYVTGTELSCRFDGELGYDYLCNCHIVGLSINVKKMQLELNKIAKNKKRLLLQLVACLKNDGYKIFDNDLSQDLLWREDVARELINKGYFANIFDVFKLLLNTDKYKIYGKNLPTIKQAIKIIKACDGTAILAHPFNMIYGGKIELTNQQVRELVCIVKGYGIQGIEVFYQNFSKDKILFLQQLATEYDLLMSIGTDYHNSSRVHMKYPEYATLLKREQLYFDVAGITPNLGIVDKL